VKPSWRKALQKFFYTLQYFGSSGWPPVPNVTGLGGGVHNPPLATCKISSRSDEKYLLPNFVDFVAGTQKTYSKRYVSTLHAATKKS